MKNINIKALRTEIEKGKRTYKAFAEADETLESLEGLGQYHKEITAAIAKGKAEKDALKKALANAKEKADFISEELDKATADAKKIRSDARAAAKKSKDAAQVKLDGFIALAKADAAALVDDAKEEVAKLAARKLKLGKQNEELKDEITLNNKELASLVKVVSDRKASIQDALSKLG